MNEVYSVKQYIELLEKTNQQLSLWSNPYGISVMILSAWVTVLAIVAAYALYKQGNDYKKKLEIDREEQKKSLASLYKKQLEILEQQKSDIDEQTEILKKKQQRIDELDDEIKGQIENYKNELKTANADEKSRIGELIKESTNQRTLLNSNIRVKPTPINITDQLYGAYSNKQETHECSVCHNKFIIDEDKFDLAMAVYPFGKELKCPFCGNVDKLS